MDFITHSPEETEAAGIAFARHLSPGDIVAYTGDLGVGKTAFTRGVALGLGYKGRVTSPTFTIVNEYEGTIPIFHFDLYRLGDEEELYDIGWEDYLTRGGVCLVEWSERITDALPPETIFLSISRCGEDENTRQITAKGGSL